MLDWLHRKSQMLDANRWPVGGSRLETTGNIVYGQCAFMICGAYLMLIFHHRFPVRHSSDVSCVALTILSMASVNLVVVTEAARTLITHKGNDLNDFHLPSVIAVSVALGVKILLFLYCFTIRQHSSQVQVRADGGGEGGVIFDSSVAMLQGLFPPTVRVSLFPHRV